MLSRYALCLLIASLTACGGGSEGTGSILGSVSGDTQVKSLSEDQRGEICANIRHKSYEASFGENWCNFASAAFPDGLLQVPAPTDEEAWNALCETARPVCEAKYSGSEEVLCLREDPEYKDKCPLDVATQLKSCSAPASLFANCILETIESQRSFQESFSCSIGYAYSKGTFYPEIKESPSCNKLFDQCDFDPAITGISFTGCNVLFSSQIR